MNQKLLGSSSHGGLRTRLIFHHLLLTLGLLTLLTVAVLISIQNYFKDEQQHHLQMHAQYAAMQCEGLYRDSRENWDAISGIIQRGDNPSLEIIIDAHRRVKILRM